MINLKTRNFALTLISTLMVSAIFFSAISVKPALAQPPTGMFIVPQDTVLYNAEVGTTFTLNVSIANVTNIAGIEWHLEWNSSLLNCTGIKEVLYHTVTPEISWDNIWSLKLTYNNTAGEAIYAQLFQDYALAQSDGYAPINVTTDAYPEGIATAILNFTVTQAPPVNMLYESDFVFTAVKVGDPEGMDMGITGQNGHYIAYGPPETTETIVTYENVNYTVITVTNASLVPESMNFSKVADNDYELYFNLTGAEGTTGYVNVTIPTSLMGISEGEDWSVVVNGTMVTPEVSSDSTNWYMYIVTPLGANTPLTIIGTIPEFTWLFIPLLMASTLVAFALRRRRKL